MDAREQSDTLPRWLIPAFPRRFLVLNPRVMSHQQCFL